jgi:hypothetical protein
LRLGSSKLGRPRRWRRMWKVAEGVCTKGARLRTRTQPAHHAVLVYSPQCSHTGSRGANSWYLRQGWGGGTPGAL